MSVSVTVQNPMSVPLPLSNVHLLWAFKSAIEKSLPNADDDNWIENERSSRKESDHLVEPCILPHLLLEPNSTNQLVLSVVPLQQGDLRLLGIAYRINYPALTSEGGALTGNSNTMSPSNSSTNSTLSVQGKQV